MGPALACRGHSIAYLVTERSAGEPIVSLSSMILKTCILSTSFRTLAPTDLNDDICGPWVLLCEALSEARSGMISLVTSSSCYFSTVHEGYHRVPKPCVVL